MGEFVGGRIVPKHCGAWNKNSKYEMLSIVYRRPEDVVVEEPVAVVCGLLGDFRAAGRSRGSPGKDSPRRTGWRYGSCGG